MQSEMDVVLAEQLCYWRKHLAGAPALLNLPTDHPRPRVQSYHEAHHTFLLPQIVLDQIDTLAQREDVTPFMILLAAFQVLLMRYSGQTDIVVGIPFAHRTQEEVAGLMGFFANTLALRLSFAEHASFQHILQQVHEITVEAYAHQELPFEKVVEDLQLERNTGYNPLVQVAFNFSEAVQSNPALLFDITLLGIPNDGLMLEWEYNADLFEATTIQRMATHYATLLQSAVSQPEQQVTEIPLLTAEERRQVLQEWNATDTAYPRQMCVHQLVEAQSEQTPDAIAVTFEDEHLTYRELNCRANQLAQYVSLLGVGPEVPIGLCLERSLMLVIAVLAILKAGGAYVPLDPTSPPERLAFMLQDAHIPLLLTQERLVARLPAHTARVVLLDTDWSAIAEQSQENLLCRTQVDNLAYVVYTSGSSGIPKGVEVQQRGILRLVLGVDYVQLDEQQTLLQMAPISFDAATFELWGALLHGGRCVLFPGEQPTIRELGQVVRTYGISTMWLTASLFNVVIDEAPYILEGVRQLLIGGEALSVSHVRRGLAYLPGTQIINGYGPTENTTFSCCHTIERNMPTSKRSIPIGKPIGNSQAYVVDQHGQPVPIGVAGELYLGGAGLARGYLNRSELTAERFVPNWFSSQPGERLYKTGDLARYLPDGTIDFLGRLDQQVKLRGFRIELGEIEAKLAAHPAVQEVVVLVREDVPHNKRIVAYVVPNVQNASLSLDNPNTLIHVLRDSLKKFLPDYMIPAAFMVLDAMPLNANGKIDRRALPLPSQDGAGRKADFVAPRTDVEKILANIWREILGMEHIGINDTFFELGGHSLLATQMITRIHSVFQIELSFRTFFEAPTIMRLLEVIKQAKGQESPKRVKPAISANARNAYRSKSSSVTHV